MKLEILIYKGQKKKGMTKWYLMVGLDFKPISKAEPWRTRK